ncbi:MAG: PEP-CTERM sorting domain-containing protein [Acidobacteria bacterium]|nr:PEP-CTERM sorting domain-containing protein [Acidobacteriota bacterium]
MKKAFLVLLGAWLVGIGIGPHFIASADPVGPGFDLFFTIPGPTGMIIPAGTIPGQETDVPVPLIGVPIGPGNTDTRVVRMSGVGGVGEPKFGEPIPIELVALSLTSPGPVPIAGGPYTVGVVEDPGVASPGTMTILHETESGGTFTSDLEVHTLVTLVAPDGSVLGPAPRTDMLSGSGSWSHTPPPGYPGGSAFPSGGFFAGPTTELGLLAAHFTQPPHDGVPVPEPSALLVLGCGVLALGAATWRRRPPR